MDRYGNAARAVLNAEERKPGRGAAIAGELLMRLFNRDEKKARAVFRALAQRIPEDDQAGVADLTENSERLIPGGPDGPGYARKKAARYAAVAQAASRRAIRERSGAGPFAGPMTEHARKMARLREEKQ
ncbi:hypothetical protein [Sagittula stellata]|uniref:Uncharacterized protein n=1 Tax=Sagittula stellata (strain ATCC 700073 / DSM 11524 / E-37) TaxID=388399 RepID=A3K8F1_SAGS3|nr:hypothetical protein [Sagittula stellata]EBA06630.1 hypothetical protein SSE37_10253 [Sagittula stellata E-37]